MHGRCKFILEKSCSWKRNKQGARVVKNLVKAIEHSGRNITCEKFFTSILLARDLLKKKLTLVVTIWKNKPELPLQFTVSIGRDITSTILDFRMML